MHETLNGPVLKSHALKSWIAASPEVEPGRIVRRVDIYDGQKERTPGQQHDLNKCFQACDEELADHPGGDSTVSKRRTNCGSVADAASG
jgi:hypothetical protein